jgi:uncharacterized protein YjlB
MSNAHETLFLGPNGRVPNSRFPVLVHRGAVAPGEDAPSAVEALFRENGWLNNWRYPGIYDYAHFHSTTHEVLGIARGQMTLRLGGEGQVEVAFSAGDVVVMPAGVSHSYLKGSDDIEVVGGYPDGRDWDLMRDEQMTDQERHDAIKRIMSLPIPDRDPVTGEAMQIWRDAPSSVQANEVSGVGDDERFATPGQAVPRGAAPGAR